MILYTLSILTLIVVLALSAEIALGVLKIQNLSFLPPEVIQPQPFVSIIVAALNEEETIYNALKSLVQLDYDNLEIIAINDRSTDNTGKKLDEFAKRHDKIQVVHISRLPPDWLGKHHALQQGTKRAKGDLLLFTDADVIIEPSTLKRAVRRMQDKNLDHLTLLFAALDYSIGKVVAVSIFMIMVGIWPYWALFLTSGPTRFINAAIIGCSLLLFGSAAHCARIPKKHLIWLPVSTYVRLYTLWRAVFVTVNQGGIFWRGTFYPLSKLKAHHIPMQGGNNGKRRNE